VGESRGGGERTRVGQGGRKVGRGVGEGGGEKVGGPEMIQQEKEKPFLGG